MRPQIISKWKGIWRDDKGRFVEIYWEETPVGLAVGWFISPLGHVHPTEKEYYRDGDHTLDGSKLIERKRGDEKGWPL